MVGGSNGARRESVVPQQANTMAVKVVVRIRPGANPDGANVPARFQRTVVQPISSTSLQADNPTPGAHAGAAVSAATAGTAKQTKQAFTYDRVIGPDEGQPALYEAAQSLVDSFLAGYNSTIFAYGPSSSGKSYSMGTDLDGVSRNVERQGITPRAVAEIFDRLAATQRDSRGGFSFEAKVSYLEIYNEELIDLLAGDADVRPTVQIREDKSGQILLQGIREIKVSSAAQVMDLLAQGSTLRQTGATDVNAQSSRSHAIFSLAVTRRKWAGTGTPPAAAPTAPSSPQNRRMSALPRMSSPAPPGRAGTPTGDRPGSRFGLRPPSSLGRASTPGTPSGDEAEGSWTISTSKLHFVDLAGSERLKRTAAAGERAKEGISINAGLSALGNVISALGDPSKKATHVPYRDSKLTRILQDSLGGNARTMMVACVSPIEANLAETVNTLRYANRARNIKNRAEVNEVEQGWDDVEYLQRTILKLRGELAAIKGGDGAALARRSLDLSSAPAEAELQQKVAQLTAELAVAQAAAPGSPTTPTAPLSRDQFAAAVEPIVEEYERSLSALESQLALARAALGHSDEEMRELEARIGEEQQANEANAALVDELRMRVAKLSEREETTEVYVRDLEARLRDVDDADESHGAAVGALRKELARNREQAAATEQHVQELEARLASAEEGNTALRRQIEVLERDVARREESHRDLEARVQLLDNSNDSKQLLAEIDEKDRRLLDLERELDALKVRADGAADEAARLQKLAQAETALKEELESRVRTLENGQARNLVVTPPRTPALRTADADSLSPPEPDAAPPTEVAALRAQVDKLRRAHAETTGELEMARTQCAESLREIDDLNAQVQEARLLRSQASASDLSDAGMSPATPRFANGPRDGRLNDDGEDDDEVEELATAAMNGGGSRNGSPAAAHRTTGPRTPHARRSMPLSPQHRLSFLGRGQGAVSPAHLRSASLSQELSLAASSQSSCPTSPRPVSPSPSSHSRRESLFGPSWISSTNNGGGERSYEQMKSEVLKLQAALDARDAEISDLETTVQQLRSPPASSAASPAGDSPFPSFPTITERPATPPPLSSRDADLLLSPQTRSHFDALKASVRDLDDSTVGLGLTTASDDDESASASRLDDLMRSMAQKESAHREAVETLEGELAQLRRQHDELTVLSKTQVENMSTEIEQLRRELEERPARGDLDAEMQRLHVEASVKAEELAAARAAHEEELGRVKAALIDGAAEHQRALESTVADHSATLDNLRRDHNTALDRAVLEREEAVRAELVTTHAAELESLRGTHAAAIAARETGDAEQVEIARAELIARHDEAVEALKRNHAAALERAQAEHASATTKHDEDLASLRQSLNQDREAALSSLREDHETSLAAVHEAHASNLDELRSTMTAEHAADSAASKQAHDDELALLRSDHTAALDRQQAEHSAALAALEASHADKLESAMQSVRAQLVGEHEQATEQIKRGHGDELERARAELAASHAAELESLRGTHAAHIAARETEDAEQVKVARAELIARHDEAVETLKRDHAAALERAQAEHASATTKHDEDLASLRQSLDQDREAALSSLREDHETSLAAVHAAHASNLDELRSTMTAEHAADSAASKQAHDVEIALLRSDHTAALDRQQAEHSAALAALEASHADKLESAMQSVRAQLVGEHEQATEQIKRGHGDELERARATTSGEQDALRARLAEEHEAAAIGLREEHDRSVEAINSSHTAAVDELRAVLSSEHAGAIDALRQEHRLALDSLRTERAAASETQTREAVAAAEAERDSLRAAHDSLEAALSAVRDELVSAQQSVTALTSERDQLAQRLDSLAAQHANFIADHAKEVNSLRQSLKVQQQAPPATATSSTELQETLAALGTLEKAQDEGERLAAVEEVRTAAQRLDSLLAQTRKERDGISAKLARMSLSSASAAPLGLGIRAQSPPVGAMSPTVDAFSVLSNRARSPTSELERATSPPLRSDRFLSNGSTFSLKAPPPTPPPSVPPPPAPHPTTPLPPLPQESPMRGVGRRSSNSSVTTSPEHRRGSLGPDPSNPSVRDSQQHLDMVRALKEQHDASVARLKQQLSQRDAEYQSQVDLVTTLESALNDSERNLRKARLQTNEYARERDALKAEADRLRLEAQDSHSASEGYRQSVIDMEERLQEQRSREARAERARLDLEARMNEVNKRKSKFACF